MATIILATITLHINSWLWSADLAVKCLTVFNVLYGLWPDSLQLTTTGYIDIVPKMHFTYKGGKASRTSPPSIMLPGMVNAVHKRTIIR